jgi:hypothetical protein
MAIIFNALTGTIMPWFKKSQKTNIRFQTKSQISNTRLQKRNIKPTKKSTELRFDYWNLELVFWIFYWNLEIGS